MDWLEWDIGAGRYSPSGIAPCPMLFSRRPATSCREFTTRPKEHTRVFIEATNPSFQGANSSGHLPRFLQLLRALSISGPFAHKLPHFFCQQIETFTCARILVFKFWVLEVALHWSHRLFFFLYLLLIYYFIYNHEPVVGEHNLSINHCWRWIIITVKRTIQIFHFYNETMRIDFQTLKYEMFLS